MRPSTPYLAIDVDRMQANIDRVATAAAARGISLRPHAKTHKCVEIARLQLRAGAVGLTVATIGEAEVFAQAGMLDLAIALPVWIDADSAGRLHRLASGGARLSIGIDAIEGVQRARRFGLAGIVGVRVEVDAGHHRSGCAPGDAGEIARAAADAGLEVEGAFSFPGHAYGPGAGAQAAQHEADALRTAVAAMRGAGIDAPVVSGGSTPSFGPALALDSSLTELRPGVSVFGDAQQWELGVMTPDELALTVHARVISRAGGRVVLDAGSKVMGADRAPWATGFGRLLDHEAARVVLLSEHHAVVQLAEGDRAPELGSIVRVVPNHVCNAVNLVDALFLVERGRSEPSDAWHVAARGRNA